MPITDSGVKVKPSALAGLASWEGPSDVGVEVEVAGGGEIIGPVDESFEGIVHSPFWCAGGFVVAGGESKFGAEQVFSVHQMDGLARTERGF